MSAGELVPQEAVYLEQNKASGETWAYGPDYAVSLREGSPRMQIIHGNTQLLDLFTGSMHTAEIPDEITDLGEIICEQQEGAVTIRREIKSPAWERKVLYVICSDRGIDISYELTAPAGQERHLDSCDYFGGNYATYNESGYFPSGTEFDRVFNPNPTCAELPTHPIGQPSVIGVTGYARPGQEHWFASPAPYCYGFGRDDLWLMAGIKAPVDEQNFTSYQYDGFENAFTLRLEYERQTAVRGTFRTPTLMWRFADTAQEGLTAYCREVRGEHASPATLLAARRQPDWWKGPIFCGWGAQAELAAAGGGVESIQSLCRQETYDDFMHTLAAHDVHPGTLTIDDKWQTAYGTNTVDVSKWPDLPAWIDRRHRLGQKVLLWLKGWDPEGVPDDWCVRTWDERKVAVDPSHPQFQESLRNQVEVMLGHDGYNADGFKIDFTGRTPSGKTLRYFGEQRGSALLHSYLKIIQDAAKSIKPDALVVTHTPNPYFHDVTDMIRLNDINTKVSVIRQMERRAMVARAALPDKPIDTDNWPMESREAWDNYLAVQPALGVPALYYAGTVAGENISEENWTHVRESWRSYNRACRTKN